MRDEEREEGGQGGGREEGGWDITLEMLRDKDLQTSMR